MEKTQENVKIKKLKVIGIIKIIEYMPNALVFKISIKLATSNITLKSINTREILFEKILLQNIDN
jgi:hypothetical protein